MNIWPLIKAYVREFELANNTTFNDAAWQRIKQLEQDIQAEHWQAVREIVDAYEKERTTAKKERPCPP